MRRPAHRTVNLVKERKSKMKLQYSFVALALAMLVVGCDRSDQSGSQTSPPPQSERQATGQEVKREMKEAVNTTRQYLAENKDEFVAKTEKKLRELDARIVELTARTGTLKEDAKAEADQLMTALRQQRSEVDKQLNALKQSSKEMWTDAKAAFETVFDELQKAYEKTKAKFSG